MIKVGEMGEHECAICGGKPAKFLSDFSYIPVCIYHQQFDTKFQVEVLQKRLGIIKEYSDKFKKCEVCDVELNSEEINTISDDDISRTCMKHREVRKWHQLDLSKMWFEYKELYPKATPESKVHWVNFMDWRKKNGK